MMKKQIPLSIPHLFGNEKKYVTNCITSNWIATSGKYISLFEKKFANLVKSKYAVACINGTSALHVALRLLKVQKGDEILVPSITFVATINSTIYNLCSPVFIDCDKYLNIDINKLTLFIKTKTYFKNGYSFNKVTKKKIIAIIVVHVFGNSVNLNNNFLKLCKSRNIKILEDAAESIGSYFLEKNKKIHTGTIGSLGCFSFNANKIITAGGGGMIVTNDKKHMNKARYLISQAKDDPDYFIHNDIGFNYKLTNIHSAIGLAQLEKLAKVLKKKKIISNFYKKNINKIKGLKILDKPKYSLSNNWMNVLIVDEKNYGKSKKKLMSILKKGGVDTRSVWFPNHLQKPFKKFQRFEVNLSYELFSKGICIPGSYSITRNDQEYILSILKRNSKTHAKK